MKWILAVTFLGTVNLHADNLGLMRRWAVFPFETPQTVKASAETAWWKFRERVTETKKYLVASRQFLVQKDAFQPRRDLSPEDVKLLANVLDADVLITGYEESRTFTLNVYLAQNGILFWTKKIAFHPSLKESDQLELAGEKIAQELISSIPYQAFTVVDPLIGKPVYEENGKKYAVVDLGKSDDLAAGSQIQWVNILLPQKGGPATIAESKVEIIGEGRITKIKRGVATVELLRAKTAESIEERTLVRIPQQVDKGYQANASQEIESHLAPELLPSLMTPVSPESESGHKTAMVFGSILSFLGIIALAL